MKHLTAVFLCALLGAALALSLAACTDGQAASAAASDVVVGSDPRTWGPAESGSAASGTSESLIGGAQIPNPFRDCATLEEAARIAGFSLTAPDTVDGYPERSIQAIDSSLIQVSFTNGDDEVLLRKAAGTDDVSGDYNEYPETNSVTVNGAAVTLKGTDGMVNVATWTADGHAFAIDVNGKGMAADAVTALVKQMG